MDRKLIDKNLNQSLIHIGNGQKKKLTSNSDSPGFYIGPYMTSLVENYPCIICIQIMCDIISEKLFL